MPLKFTILEHTVNGDAHFDLMLEVEGQELLRTFQLAKWPLVVGESCRARKLADHRRAYLDYEGEISGGRGTVRRVAHGEWSGDLQLQLADKTCVEIAIKLDSVARLR